MRHRAAFKTILLTLLLAVTAALSGCGPQMLVTSNSGTIQMQGMVHGGQQPVSGATVQLYVAGTGGNGTAATPLIPTVTNGYYLGGAPGCVASSTQVCYSNVLSDANGNFTIAGDFTCPSNTSQVYLVATGGNPGLTAGTNNSALAMMTAVGNCNSLFTSNKYVMINEVTTVAAAWALAQFMKSYDHVASSSTNTAGMANAMLNAGLLANPSGMAGTPPAGMTLETNKLYALANSLAPCVNSSGNGCSALFSAATPAGGTAPTNTVGAALNIVRNPGQNVVAVYQAATGVPPYATGLTKAPNDWTMSMTITNSSFLLPTALDIDANGYVWAVGQEGTIYELSPQGTVLSGSGFGQYLQESFGLTIDTNGYLWVTDYQSGYNNPPATGYGALVEFQTTTSGGTPGAILSTYGFREDPSIMYPLAVSADTNGTVFLLNSDPSSASVYTNGTQNPLSASLGQYTYYIVNPTALAVDNAHGFWMADSDNTVSHYSSTGAVEGYVTCCNESNGIATDSFGNAWVASYGNNSFSEVTNANTVPLNQVSTGGVYYPEGVAVDAGQNVWFANYRGKSISEIAGNAGTVLMGTSTALAAGTAISPTTGVYTTGGYGLDAKMNTPIAVVPDTAGNLWVADQDNSDFVMFFGLATPTKMPVQPSPTAP
jgi:streptogramin lyase